MNCFVQVVLKVLRCMHIDVYTMLKNHAERQMWRRALPQNGDVDHAGLCIALAIRSFSSEAQVGRDFVRRLMKTSIPFTLFDLDFGYSVGGKIPTEEVADLLALASPRISCRNVLAFVNGAVHGDCHFVYANQPWWEFGAGLLEFNPAVFSGVRHVVAGSDFCKAYFSSIIPPGVQVHKIRYGYDESWCQNELREITRKRYGIASEDFVVMFHFMFGSSAARKNPQGALAAFMKAFEHEPRARLVLKMAEVNKTSEAYLALMRCIEPIRDRVTIVEGFLSRQEILNLLAASDAYLSLHRGEGLGIGMLEAMAVGTPVVCTNYGGNTEFCRLDTAFIVDYDMIPNGHPDHFYAGVSRWPEPNIDTAAQHLRAIFDDPTIGRVKSDQALTFVRDHFSLKKFESDLRRFIDAMAK